MSSEESLPESEYSYVLQDWAGAFGVEHAFGRTAETQGAYLFHAEGSDEASAFVRDRTLRLLRGEVGYVIGFATNSNSTPPADPAITLPR